MSLVWALKFQTEWLTYYYLIILLTKLVKNCFNIRLNVEILKLFWNFWEIKFYP